MEIKIYQNARNFAKLEKCELEDSIISLLKQIDHLKYNDSKSGSILIERIERNIGHNKDQINVFNTILQTLSSLLDYETKPKTYNNNIQIQMRIFENKICSLKQELHLNELNKIVRNEENLKITTQLEKLKQKVLEAETSITKINTMISFINTFLDSHSLHTDN